jgi:hypothetical protein
VRLENAVSPPLNPSVSRSEFHRYGRRRSQVRAIRAWLHGSLHRSASQDSSRILRLWDQPSGEAKATLKPTAANSVARFWWIWSALISVGARCESSLLGRVDGLRNGLYFPCHYSIRSPEFVVCRDWTWMVRRYPCHVQLFPSNRSNSFDRGRLINVTKIQVLDMMCHPPCQR